MPLVTSSYKPGLFFRNGHFATIYPHLFRKIKDINYDRQRFDLPDGDFIDLDWKINERHPNKKIAIIIHGLEGNTDRQYMLGAAKHLSSHKYDVLAINLRNCSTDSNRLYKSYNGGTTEDIKEVVKLVKNKSYNQIHLLGFSLGGNLILKFLGEDIKVAGCISSAVAVSVPCDLYDALLQIDRPHNFIYQKRFLKHLKQKLYQKCKDFPNKITKKDVDQCKSLIDIDNLYTSKAHGYKDALDYYDKCSAIRFLENIKVPTLIINALDDPFLGKLCYPYDEAERNANLYLETPGYGGHVGFTDKGTISYTEKRTIAFFDKENLT